MPETPPPAKPAFHVALAVGVIPMLGALLTGVIARTHAADRHRSDSAGRWSRRLHLLSLLDLLVALAFGWLLISGGLARLEKEGETATPPAPRELPDLFEPTGVPWSLDLGWADAVPLGLVAIFALATRRPRAWAGFLVVYVGSSATAQLFSWAAARLQGGVSLGAWLLTLLAQSAAMILLCLPFLRRPAAEPPPALSIVRTFFVGVGYLVCYLPRAGVLVSALMAAAPEGLPAPSDPIGALAKFPLDGTGWALLFVGVAVLGPISEELLFRGLLLPRLASGAGATAALAMSAAVFAAMHTHYGLQAAVLLVHGLVLGWARLRSGGLQAPMAIHALVNAFSLTVMRALSQNA